MKVYSQKAFEDAQRISRAAKDEFDWFAAMLALKYAYGYADIFGMNAENYYGDN